MIPLFERGLEELGITEERIPDLSDVNEKLKAKTGFKGIAVTGFEDPKSFFPMLARREFPVGNFIRDKRDLNYTPAPDVFHDLYGHLPFFVDRQYANFCQKFGEYGSEFLNDDRKLKEWDRLFWYTIEFALLETSAGRRIFGAGIASSYGECAYSLDPVSGPTVVPFDPEVIRHQDFKIDEMQKKLFLIQDLEDLYGCLEIFREKTS
jgi:phenylalanine-4-hydroxylase